MFNRSRKGFTLVELLVVTGIIAILLGILLPTIGRARAAADKVKCASQLRQIGQFAAMYAGTYNNFLPIGYIRYESYAPGNSVLWFMQKAPFNTNGPVGLGYLFSSNIIKPGQEFNRQVWYCPSVPDNWALSYNHPRNRWVDIPISNQQAMAWPSSQIALKMGYSSRPLLTSKFGDEQTLSWAAGPGGTATNFSAPAYFNTAGMSGAKLRSTNVFKGKAIVSDFNEDPRLINGVHKNGVNVLYASYAVKWIPLEMFKQEMYSGQNLVIKINGGPHQPNYTYAGDWFALGRMWENFDRQQ